MAKEQRLITPLVESGIQVEPPTPPAMGLNTRIQRAWSMLFGRRENTLQPIYASRGGMLGVVALDLNGWTLAYTGTPEDSWTDMGQIVDLIMFAGFDDALLAPSMQFGPDGATITHTVFPSIVTVGYDGSDALIAVSGCIHVRTRWIRTFNCFAWDGLLTAYTAPKR